MAFEPVKRGEVLCQVLPSGAGFENDNNLKLFTALFYGARSNVCYDCRAFG